MGHSQPYSRQSHTHQPQQPGSSPGVMQTFLSTVGTDPGLCQQAGPSSALSPARSLPAPSTFPGPFPWTQPAAPRQPLQQAPSDAHGTAASQALISSVFNLTCTTMDLSSLQYWMGRRRPVPTDPSTWYQTTSLPCSSKTKTPKFPSIYGKISLTTFPI